jgi:hypothetical protein
MRITNVSCSRTLNWKKKNIASAMCRSNRRPMPRGAHSVIRY